MTAPSIIEAILKNALLEDIGEGDVTTRAVVPENHISEASLIAKETFVLAGLAFSEKIFSLVDSALIFKPGKKDGDTVRKGNVIAKISGNTGSLLAGERTALNFLQRLSGIATLTRKFVENADTPGVKITDTRKTTPGLRVLEKYAVKVGGGNNHRFGLFDGILIKDNHINAAGGIKKAVMLAKKNAQKKFKIEVETRNPGDVRQALAAGAEIIMLDNMPLEDIKASVKIIRSQNPRVLIEVSGNIKPENIRAVAKTGIDLVSTGAITHSATAVDISMITQTLHRIN